MSWLTDQQPAIHSYSFIHSFIHSTKKNVTNHLPSCLLNLNSTLIRSSKSYCYSRIPPHGPHLPPLPPSHSISPSCTPSHTNPPPPHDAFRLRLPAVPPGCMMMCIGIGLCVSSPLLWIGYKSGTVFTSSPMQAPEAPLGLSLDIAPMGQASSQSASLTASFDMV